MDKLFLLNFILIYLFNLKIDITSHKILFEDIKTKNESVKEIIFTGTLFAILGTKLLDCTLGTDHAILRSTKQLKEKFSMKVLLDTCSFCE